MVGGSFAHTGGPYCQYGLMLWHSPDFIQDVRPDIGDAPLTLY